MKLIKSWTCPSCNRAIATAYCPDCGETTSVEELTVRGLFDRALRAFSTVEGRLLRSFRALLTAPGALTVEYVRGRRIHFVGPFQLFLFANVLFFAMQSLTNTNIVSSTLDSHLHLQDWSAFAQAQVAHRLAATHTTLKSYTPFFNKAVVLNAKSLIILMVLPFAGLLLTLFYHSRQPVFAHVVFSLYFYAFLLLVFCVSLAIAAVEQLLGGGGLSSARMDNILTAVNLVACAVYLYIATGKVYGATGLMRIFKVVMLAIAVEAILLGYRFVLFMITLYTT